MNWDRGLIRLTLILSIVVAILGGMFGYQNAKETRTYYSEETGFKITAYEPTKGFFVTKGIVTGFLGVWGIYAVARWIASPAYRWVARGFREGKQTHHKKNE